MVLQAQLKAAAGKPTNQRVSSLIPAVLQPQQQQQSQQQQQAQQQQQQAQQSDMEGEDVHMLGSTPTGSSAMDRLAALTANNASSDKVSAVPAAHPCTAFLPVMLAMLMSGLLQLFSNCE